MTRMTSVMTSSGDLDNTGVQMKTYMTNEDSADKAEDHGSKKMVLATMDNVNGLGEMEVRNMNIIRTPNSMVYRTDMQVKHFHYLQQPLVTYSTGLRLDFTKVHRNEVYVLMWYYFNFCSAQWIWSTCPWTPPPGAPSSQDA